MKKFTQPNNWIKMFLAWTCTKCYRNYFHLKTLREKLTLSGFICEVLIFANIRELRWMWNHEINFWCICCEEVLLGAKCQLQDHILVNVFKGSLSAKIYWCILLTIFGKQIYYMTCNIVQCISTKIVDVIILGSNRPNPRGKNEKDFDINLHVYWSLIICLENRWVPSGHRHPCRFLFGLWPVLVSTLIVLIVSY